MSADQITAIAAAILSLAFSYIPGLRSRYEPLGDEYKRLIMLGLLVLVTVGVFALACSRFGLFLGLGDGEHRLVACDESGLVGLLWTLVLSVMANQSTYLITKRTK